MDPEILEQAAGAIENYTGSLQANERQNLEL